MSLQDMANDGLVGHLPNEANTNYLS
jgi:hypothetical protein